MKGGGGGGDSDTILSGALSTVEIRDILVAKIRGSSDLCLFDFDVFVRIPCRYFLSIRRICAYILHYTSGHGCTLLGVPT